MFCWYRWIIGVFVVVVHSVYAHTTTSSGAYSGTVSHYYTLSMRQFVLSEASIGAFSDEVYACLCNSSTQEGAQATITVNIINASSSIAAGTDITPGNSYNLQPGGAWSSGELCTSKLSKVKVNGAIDSVATGEAADLWMAIINNSTSECQEATWGGGAGSISYSHSVTSNGIDITRYDRYGMCDYNSVIHSYYMARSLCGDHPILGFKLSAPSTNKAQTYTFNFTVAGAQD